MIRLTVRLEEKLNDHLTTISQVLSIHKSQIIRDLLVEYILDMEKNPDYNRRYAEWLEKQTAKYGT